MTTESPRVTDRLGIVSHWELEQISREMLEALEAIEQLDDDPNGWDAYCAKVRAAIRKAKGE